MDSVKRDILAIVETWLQPDEEQLLTLPGTVLHMSVETNVVGELVLQSKMEFLIGYSPNLKVTVLCSLFGLKIVIMCRVSYTDLLTMILIIL